MTTPESSSGPAPKKGLKWIETDAQRKDVEVKLPKEISHEEMFYSPGSTRDKVAVVMKNPLVPLGMLATVAALTLGLRANLKGDRFRQQMMMRYRVGFQGFTVLMLVGGLAATQYFAGSSDG